MPDVFSPEVPKLLATHLGQLSKGSGIAIDVIKERGYRSILGKKELKELGFSRVQCQNPGLLIPLCGVDSQKIGYTYRPDNPRSDSRGKVVKYENPRCSSLRLDCPPRCRNRLGDPSVSLWITEGIKKGDALASYGLCTVVLPGVWGFKGKNKLGGVTLLADWDQVALNRRKVHIVFDSDIMGKPEVRKALERLTEHLRRKGAEVFHVLLPSENGEKVGVDDYLLKHGVNDLIRLAVKAPSEVAPPRAEDMIVGLIEEVQTGKLEAKKAVSVLRDIDAPPHIRRKLIALLALTVLKKLGTFISSLEGRFYFHKERKELLELDSFEFGALLNQLLGLNQTEREFQYVLADANTEAHYNGLKTKIRRFAYFEIDKCLLYIDRFDGQVYKLDGQTIELVDNGTDGVLFSRQPNWSPWRYIDSAPANGLLSELLVDDVNFAKDAFAPLSPGEQRLIFSLWMLSLFFESLLPTKPILVLVGEKGSGKTTALRRVVRFLFGPSADVTGLEREKEDAFVAAITANYLVVFDNVDGKVTWVNDRLATAATGSLIQRRRLYTTNDVAIYQPQCFLALTSRNPQFKRDDVVDRLILLKVDRLNEFCPEREMLRDIDAKRDLLWTELLNDLSSVVAMLKQASGQLKAQFRMADWGTLCWRIAQLQELGDSFSTVLDKLSREQSVFLLEDDPLYICLTAWLQDPANVGREVTAKALFTELKEIAEREGMAWYKSPIALAKRLNNVKSNLGHLLCLGVQSDNRGRTCYSFSPVEVHNDEMTR